MAADDVDLYVCGCELWYFCPSLENSSIYLAAIFSANAHRMTTQFAPHEVGKISKACNGSIQGVLLKTLTPSRLQQWKGYFLLP